MSPLPPAVQEGLGQNLQLLHSLARTADSCLQGVPVGFALTFLALQLPYRKGIEGRKPSLFVTGDPLIQPPSGPQPSRELLIPGWQMSWMAVPSSPPKCNWITGAQVPSPGKSGLQGEMVIHLTGPCVEANTQQSLASQLHCHTQDFPTETTPANGPSTC